MVEKSDQPRRYTTNQVVAHNLRLARQQRGWTQEQAAERLEPFLGVRWSKATYSAAERSSERADRVRQFTADDLLAFSAAFDVPAHYFFLPPIGKRNGTNVQVAAGDKASTRAFGLAEYLDRVFGSDKGNELVQRRLKAILKRIPSDPKEEHLRQATQGLVKARLSEHKDELETWRDALLGLLFVVDETHLDLFFHRSGFATTEMKNRMERLLARAEQMAQTEDEAEDADDLAEDD